MIKTILIIVVCAVTAFCLLAWYGSTIPDETYAQKVTRIEKICSTEYNPQQCELTEIARIVDKEQTDHQKYLDQQVGN